MTPVLHYPLLEPHNARDTAPNEARGADDASPQRAQQGRPRQKSPSTGLPAAFPRKSSPGAARPAAFPRKSSPNAPENSVFRPFWACRANFFALAPTPGRAGRTFSRTGRFDMAALKPMTPLQPLTRASTKPPSPLRAPKQRPLKPTTPLQPKNRRNTPISHPQRRRRFQLGPRLREQRRHGFQPHTGTSEQRRQRFHTTDLRHSRIATNPLPRKLARNSIG